MGELLQKFLFVFYIIIMVAYALDREWIKVEYWLGATILTHSILMMKG